MNPIGQTLGGTLFKRSEQDSSSQRNPDLSRISKLLLNAWSAEYALRLKPLHIDREYLNHSLNWVYPQSYYAVFFSARAVLALDGINMSSQDSVEKLLRQWSTLAHYGPAFTQQGDPFTELFDQRIKAHESPRLLSGPEAAALHVRLLQRVNKVCTFHEAYIHHRLGIPTYSALLAKTPQYLREAFVNERATMLQTIHF